MKHLFMFLLAVTLVGCQGEQDNSTETKPSDAPDESHSSGLGEDPMALSSERSGPAGQSVQEKLSGMDATVVPDPDGGIRGVLFQGTNVSREALELVVEIPELVTLSFSGTSVGDVEIERISKLTNLRNLLIGGTQVTDDGLLHLKSLPNLERLGLGDTKVTDAGLNHLQGFSNLKKLFIGETKVTDEGVAAFQEAVPGCHIER